MTPFQRLILGMAAGLGPLPSISPPRFELLPPDPIPEPLDWKLSDFNIRIPSAVVVQPFREPDFCECGPPCPGTGNPNRRCALCGLKFPPCLPDCSELGGHLRACPNNNRPPKFRPRPWAERIARRKRHWGKVKARR